MPKKVQSALFDIQEASKVEKKKNGVPHFQPKGGIGAKGTEVPYTDLIRRFVEADAALKAAEKKRKELEPVMTELGLDYIAQHNCGIADDPKSLIKSVKLEGKSQEGELLPPTVMLTWTEKSKTADSAAVKAWFEQLKTQAGQPAKLRDYAEWKLGASFDTTVFFVAGKFDGKRYGAFMEALASVAEHYGLPNPLSVTKSLVPKPDFAVRRFVDFTAEQNVQMQAHFPMTTALKVVAGADE